MSKNIFISVGSTAINGMIRLIERLKQDGLYSTNVAEKNSWDLFVGIDSDSTVLEKLKILDPDPSHIYGVQLSLDENSVECSVAENFEQSWKNLPQIPVAGVGGDRRLSYATLNWKSFWQKLNISSRLFKGDRVILFGSAFGGTSTGLYWNLAEFIQAQIRINMNQTGEIEFYSLLLMPEKSATIATSYPQTKNLCAFLKDMQSIEWRNVLTKRLCDNGRNFTYPSYVGLDKSAPNFLPMREKGISTSATNIPMDMIFILPTPDNAQGQTPNFFAELSYTLFYLNLAKNIVPATVDLAKNAPEDVCFGGFNMICVRNPSNSLLKRYFYHTLELKWKNFINGKVNTSNNQEIESICDLIGEISVCDDKNANEQFNDEKQKIIDTINRTPLKDMLVTLPEELKQFAETTCASTPFKWSSFSELLRKIVESKKDLHGNKSPIAKSYGNLSLDAICNAYRKVYDQAKKKSQDAEIDDNISKTIKKGLAIRNKRGRSKWAKILNASAGVKEEVENETRKHLITLFEEFVDQRRWRATIDKMPLPLSTDDMRKAMKSRISFISSYIRQEIEPQKNGRYGFLFEGGEENVQLNLNSNGAEFSDLCLKAILASSEGAVESLFSEYTNDGIRNLRIEAEKLDANNPLKRVHTKVPVSELESYSNVFAVDKPDKGDFHFCFTCGPKENMDWFTWGDLKDKLNFKSFGSLVGCGADNVVAKLDDTTISGPQKSWIYENKSSDDRFKNAQGIWLGTLSVNFGMRNILSKIFSACPIDSWESNAWTDEELNGGLKRRLYSLKNTVYLGLVFGAIEQKIIQENKITPENFNMKNIDFSIKTSDGKSILNVSGNLESLGFAIERDSVILKRVPVSWIKQLSAWFNDDVSDQGFINSCNLNKADSIERKLLFERQCINSLKMSIPNDFYAQIEELYDCISKMIYVNVK